MRIGTLLVVLFACLSWGVVSGTEKKETHQFQAEVAKLMKIIVDSLYSNPEIFLRELISNSNDALDKIRFLSLTDPSVLESTPELKIEVSAFEDNMTFVIRDYGIGMTHDELVQNLGTIAHSGASDFLKKYSSDGLTPQNTGIIGQFGVGFYSAFLVADKVTVQSKSNQDDQYVWESDAAGEYHIYKDPEGNSLKRGTKITLHIKEDFEHYARPHRLEELAKKYSAFINFPILIWSQEVREVEVPLSEEELEAEREKRRKEKEDSDSINFDENDSAVFDEEEDLTDDEDIPLTKKTSVSEWEWKLVNSQKPIWSREPNEASTSEYNDFFRTFYKEEEDPMAYLHFAAEGEMAFKALIYIPERPLSHIISTDSLKNDLRLYVKKVFITDKFDDWMPRYLSFVKGIIDSDEIDLNVSRELIQQTRALNTIKSTIIRKTIAMLQKIAKDDPEKYTRMYAQYGSHLKLGVLEDYNNRARISHLLRFPTSDSAAGSLTSLRAYVDRMKEGQEDIYFIPGDSREALEASPLVEGLLKRGYEVLFTTDAIDEYVMTQLKRYDGKYNLRNVLREDVNLPEDEATKEALTELEEEYRDVVAWIRDVLHKKISKVTLSHRLDSSPTAISAGAAGWTPNQERIYNAQAMSMEGKKAKVDVKKIMEINPNHEIVLGLKNSLASRGRTPEAESLIHLLYHSALLASGYQLEDPHSFAGDLNGIIAERLRSE